MRNSLVLCLILLSNCDSLPFYLLDQGLHQGSILLKAKKINTLIKNKNIDVETKEKLKLAQKVIQFCKNELKFNIDTSYSTYVYLQNDYLIQAVNAAYKNKLEPYNFKYPIYGELPYKGFFKEEDAKKLEKKLINQGLDTHRRKVSAYSTLGWLSDPIYSTMLNDDFNLIETLIHELVHKQVYLKDNADFNEALATWYARKAMKDFINSKYFVSKDKKLWQIKINQSEKQNILMIKAVQTSINKARNFYKNNKDLNKRDELFNEIYQLFKSSGLIKKTFKKETINNAWILGLATYLDWIPNIEKYAIKNNISYKKLLLLAKKQKHNLIINISKI